MLDFVVDLAIRLLTGFDVFVLVYFALLNGGYIVLCAISYVTVQRHLRQRMFIEDLHLFRHGLLPPLSVICPAYNEEATITTNLRSLLTLEYPNLRVIVVNDGSKDRTLELVKNAYRVEPVDFAPSGSIDTAPVRGVYRSTLQERLLVVDKENGGKADAMNVGLNFARTPLVCMIDADSLPDPQALVRSVREFIDNGSTIAAGGVIGIMNGSEVRNGRVVFPTVPGNVLARFQVVEYLRAFLFGRMGWSANNSIPIISGAFGVFSRRAVMEVDGYSADSIGEDMDLIVRMHLHFRDLGEPYSIAFLAEPICWTEAPESISVLESQRKRWQRGLIDSLVRNRRAILNPRYGAFGMITLPFFVLFELIGPVIEFIGVIAFAFSLALGILDLSFVAWFFSVAILLGMALSLCAIALEGLTYRRYENVRACFLMIAFALLENLGYRQLTAYWRCKGIVEFLRGHNSWGTMTRKGTVDIAARDRAA